MAPEQTPQGYTLPRNLVIGLILAIFTELVIIGGYMVQWNVEYQINSAMIDTRLDHLEQKVNRSK